MFANCCTRCEREVPPSNSETKTPQKQLITMFSRRHRRNNKPSQITFHEESSINLTHKNQSQQVRPKTCRQNSQRQEVSFMTSKYDVHSNGILNTSSTSQPNHFLATHRNITFNQPPSNSYFRNRKASYIYEGEKMYKSKILNAQQEHEHLKESKILEVHSPRTNIQHSYQGGIKQNKSPFQQIQMMSMDESIIKQNKLLDGLSIGRLLGKGKYCHVYMCQDKRSHFVFALKYIFKQEFSVAPLHLSINNSLKLLMDLDHPSVTSVYKVVEDKDKISILQEYLPTLLYDQLMSRKKLPIQTVRNYLKQIIEAIVILHDNNRAHGDLTPLHIGSNMGVCKIRVSLNKISSGQPQYLRDIHNIGLIGYQMAYGLYRSAEDSGIYLNDFEHYSHPQFKFQIIQDIRLKSSSSLEQSQLKSFLLQLFEQKDNLRISGSGCLTHPFFDGLQ